MLATLSFSELYSPELYGTLKLISDSIIYWNDLRVFEMQQVFNHFGVNQKRSVYEIPDF